MVIDVSSTGVKPDMDLYQIYYDLFTTPLLSSDPSQLSIPTYSRDELRFYVVDLDPTVFANYGLDSQGNFSYEVSSVPTGNCTWINVVVVVK